MEELNKINDATPEQRKEISKVLSKSRLNLMFTGIKFAVGLFSANLICILIAATFLKDTDPDMIVGFQFVSIGINFVFMAKYLDGQIRANADIVSSKIKEILKNNQSDQGNIDEK